MVHCPLFIYHHQGSQNWHYLGAQHTAIIVLFTSIILSHCTYSHTVHPHWLLFHLWPYQYISLILFQKSDFCKYYTTCWASSMKPTMSFISNFKGMCYSFHFLLQGDNPTLGPIMELESIKDKSVQKEKNKIGKQLSCKYYLLLTIFTWDEPTRYTYRLSIIISTGQRKHSWSLSPLLEAFSMSAMALWTSIGDCLF